TVYSPELQAMVVDEAKAAGVEVRRGIYGALSGPSYETPSEIVLLRNLGADAVGMSTVPEAIVARQMGLEVLGISCITNMAAGVSDEPISHEEVMATGDRVRATFTELLRRVIGGISKRV
ncbi:MAG TPA: purine-nucleoside phosphorylase, partial [Pyrinomonadaceae bacterium]|nr:purine-nucleoside phosphorylase [Pyrinomonadaceae bacterium]